MSRVHAPHLQLLPRRSSRVQAKAAPRTAQSLLLLPLLLGLILAAGCETTGAQRTDGNDMADHYRAGRFQQAYDAARPQTERGSPGDRAHARYIAGVSAYQLGRHDDAARHLRPLVGHSDRQLAGRANATLGLVNLNRRRYESAIRALNRAVDRLDGEDRAHAYYHLALAQQRLGRWTQSRTSLSQAMNHSRDADFRRVVQQRVSTTGFTLQLGAFSSRDNAETHAREVRSAANRANVGSPRVIPSTTSDGRRLYLVQVGNFASFDSALNARRRLGRTDTIITILK